ncbi:SWIM zinc finger family protein [Clostridium tyrobutyricum]|uniref:SWIM zinc finger family protein n=1 Tax=Clostridium tyrobutyricum TaxID=1519 RepID=UPI0039F719DC
MNINNFQNNVDRKILDRGYDYYIDENIVEFYKKYNNEYVFLIEGSDKYRVDIKIDKDGEILYSNCDCPYDFGAVCKHQIAAFFKLEELLNGKSTDNKLEECQIENKPSMEKILESLSKKKLIDIIENIVENDDVLKNRIVFKYSQVDRDKEIKRCKELMNSIVRKYKGRDGFVSYSEAYDFADEMEIILERIKVICETGNDLLLSLEIAFMILNKSMEAFQYTDDSDGNIGMFVSETIKLIGEIAHSSKNMNISREIFNKLLKEAESDVFDGWNDYRIDLIEICSEFADNEEFREQLKIRIESLINGMSDNSYSKYGIERMSLILFNIIDKYGKRKESEKFIQKNID